MPSCWTSRLFCLKYLPLRLGYQKPFSFTATVTWVIKLRCTYSAILISGSAQLNPTGASERYSPCFLRACSQGGVGGGGPDFKWQGWSNGGKNQNPKTSLGLHTKPNKIPGPKFHFSLFAELRGRAYVVTITNLQIVLNTQKIPT